MAGGKGSNSGGGSASRQRKKKGRNVHVAIEMNLPPATPTAPAAPSQGRPLIETRVLLFFLFLVCWILSVCFLRLGAARSSRSSLEVLLVWIAILTPGVICGWHVVNRRLVPELRRRGATVLILAIDLIGIGLSATVMVGSSKVTVSQDYHDLVFILVILFTILILEIALIDRDDFGIFEMLLGMGLGMLAKSLAVKYLLPITFVIVSIRVFTIWKMEKNKLKEEERVKKQESEDKLQEIKSCWKNTRDSLQSKGDLESYPDFLKMGVLIEDLETEKK